MIQILEKDLNEILTKILHSLGQTSRSRTSTRKQQQLLQQPLQPQSWVRRLTDDDDARGDVPGDELDDELLDYGRHYIPLVKRPMMRMTLTSPSSVCPSLSRRMMFNLLLVMHVYSIKRLLVLLKKWTFSSPDTSNFLYFLLHKCLIMTWGDKSFLYCDHKYCIRMWKKGMNKLRMIWKTRRDCLTRGGDELCSNFYFAPCFGSCGQQMMVMKIREYFWRQEISCL